jgi:hypothetical protein
MATNILTLTAADSGKTLPLRGDMGVALNFTPADNHFRVSFMTQDAGTFIIGSTARMFRALNASAQSSLSVGGKVGLFIELMYDTDKNEFVVTKNNLVAGEESGTGGTGTAATIAVAQTVTGAPGTAALVENIGSASAVQLKFTIPAGQNGTNATGGTGSALPPGGATAQYLGKTGSADGQVGWLTLPTGSNTPGSGTGIGAMSEVLLTQAADGSITPDKALGNRFRVMLTKAVTIKNPVGYTPGEDIAIALRQGPLGPFPADWGNAYAFKDRQPPVLPQQPGALVEVFARLTDDIDADNKGGWMTRVTPDASTPTASVVGYGVASFIARNVTTSTGYYVLRSGTVPAAQCAMTAMRPGETLKIVRNGLGIEAYGGLEGGVNGAGTYRITGVLPNTNRAELRTGPGVRPAFNRGVLTFGDGIVATVQDLILSGAREQGTGSHVAQGISVTGSSNVTLKNLLIYDNENGILSGNEDYTGALAIIDCVFDANGVGDYGFTHNIYMGHNPTGWSALRTTFKECVGGHNIKSRAWTTTLNQVHCYNSRNGRELDVPNGGKVYATDCIFEHLSSAAQNDCVRIVDTFDFDGNRAREYIFRNCHFANGIDPGREASYVWNNDPSVPVYLIDCTFAGAKGNGVTSTTVWPQTDNNGNRGNVIVQFTPGVTPGPRVPVGYQLIATTPVAG